MSDRLRHERLTACAAGLSCALAMFFLLSGCGGGAAAVPQWAHVQRVTGTVTLANGEPLSRGKVVLTPQQEPKEPLFGWLDTDGAFTLMEGQGQTVAHGKFQVHIEPLAVPKDLAKTPKAQAILAKLQQRAQRIPPKYQKPETSGLTATITSTTKELPTFVLK